MVRFRRSATGHWPPPTRALSIALCQINPTVGDLAGNARLVLDAASAHPTQGAELAVFPELALTGYPPQDLLDRPAFLDDADAALAFVAAEAPSGLGIIIGAPRRSQAPHGKRIVNAACVLDGGQVVDEVAKALLPTYDVFDETRYFAASRPSRRASSRFAVCGWVCTCARTCGTTPTRTTPRRRA